MTPYEVDNSSCIVISVEATTKLNRSKCIMFEPSGCMSTFTHMYLHQKIYDTVGYSWVQLDTAGYSGVQLGTVGYRWIQLDTDGYSWIQIYLKFGYRYI